MSSPEPLAQGEENDTVPELPSGHTPVATHANVHHSSPKVSSPKVAYQGGPDLGRTASHASSVNVDFFDPEGVQHLRQTLSRMSATGAERAQSIPSSADTAVMDEKFDFEKVLRGLMEKVHEDDKIKKRELGVMFKDLRVVGLGASATYQQTLGSLLNPLNILKEIHNVRHPAVRDILSKFYGVVRPGEMLLVLGRPGAGCTTLLKVLANQRSEYHAIEGDVHYHAFSPAEIQKHYCGDVQYCPEDDVHFPTLTVEQTLTFAAKTRTPRYRVDGRSREEYNRTIVEILSTVFGLRHVQQTLVGDAAIRGVSGGEKKRVSISEALATRSLITSWDNSTRGLDASTSLEFVQALRIATDIARMTTIVSIYQAGESLYELFDKVAVVYEGKMAYFGPADRARQYFIDLGYEPANRQTTADFLVAVTDPHGRITRSGFESRAPRTALEFAAAYDRSKTAQDNREDVAAYENEFVGRAELAHAYKESAKAEHAKTAARKSPFIISIPMQAKALMTRRLQIIRGGIAVQFIQVAVFIIQAIIMGTVFLKVPDSTSAFFSRGGVLFFAILFAALTAQAEIPALFAQRPIVLRQSRAAMYHPFVESLAYTLVDIPIAGATLIIFSIILYFLVRLQQSAGQFFIFYLFVITMTVVMRSWFRTIASVFKTPAPAQTVAGLATLILVLYTGYTIPQPSMIGALRWITYLNPLRYGFEAMVVNEFHTLVAECASLIPQGPGYENISIMNQVCTTVGSVPGQATVSGTSYVELSYNYSYSHLWRNFGICIVFGVGFMAMYFTFTEMNNSAATESAVTLFKRGAKVAAVRDAEGSGGEGADEEKAPRGSDLATQTGSLVEEEKAATGAAPVMTDVFTWHHLNYTVPVPGGTRKLLDDVSGYVAPGKLTALMGESGAGKTTLLNVLAQRTSSGVVTGDRLVNGQALPADFQAQTGYCQQMDTHSPTTTVREALLFSAKLRQPASVPDEEKEAYVEQCLKMCGLSAHADAIVGSLGVEHRKRTTIAVELAAKPRLLLFLDEPTSGLDSQSAWAIVSFLRDLADQGLSILCTIHQPSGELFQVFDRLLLLKKGGQTVYHGDIGPSSKTMISYFERNGAAKCGPEENPAEYILTSIGAGATAVATNDWYGSWQASPEAVKLEKEIQDIYSEGRNRPAVETTLHHEFSTKWTYQVSQLLRREFASHWRDPTYLMAKIALNIVAGLFIGFTFWRAKDSMQGTQNKLFAIYMSTIISVPLANQLQVPFIKTRTIYEIRERPSRMYSWTAMLTAQIIAEIPWNILGSSLYFLCWYWTVGFPSDRGGFTYFLYSVVNPFYYTTIGQAVAAMSPSTEIAALLFSFLFSFVITFNGVLQPFRLLGWWQWMYRVSPYTYLIEGLLGQAIGRSEITCSALELVQVTPPTGQTCSQFLDPFIASAGGYLTNPDATSACSYCSFRTTDQFLSSNFNIEYSHHWRNFGFMWIFIAFNVFAIYAFTWFFRIRTGSLIGSLKARLARRKS